MINKVKQVQFEEQQVPKRITVGEQVYNFLVNAGDEGAILMEIYDALPNIGDRHIRQCVRDFVGQNLLDTRTTCRCGRGTIYIAKSVMKLKPYKPRNFLQHKVQNKQIHTKKYNDGKIMGKDGKRVKVKV